MKTRFCPSPTGLIHLGNARTALFNVLLAKHHNSTFLLRIEDTDETRSKTEFTEQLITDLHWLGWDWQEGPEVGGKQSSYFQSQRQTIYDKYYKQLIAAKRAYPCFCSEQTLAISRKIQLSSGRPPRYAGTCRHLTEEQIKAKQAEGLKPTLRFRVPDDDVIEFDDIVRGVQHFQTNDIGDFIVRRADGTPPFMFCNAVDDAEMGVTHVLRGEDHLTNTPRQLMIFQALNLTAPTYAHISLIIGNDGSPLSKRHGSKSIKELKEMGYLPLAISNYLARLGHYYENNQFMSLEQLATEFAFTHLSKSPARYDVAQLHHWQHEALQQLPTDDIWQWMGKSVQQLVPTEQQQLFIDAIRGNITFPQDALNWAQRFFNKHIHYDIAATDIISEAGKSFFDVALELSSDTSIDYQSLCQGLKDRLHVKGKKLFKPLRYSLTGTGDGPELTHIFSLLGPERCQQRFKSALETLI